MNTPLDLAIWLLPILIFSLLIYAVGMLLYRSIRRKIQKRRYPELYYMTIQIDTLNKALIVCIRNYNNTHLKYLECSQRLAREQSSLTIEWLQDDLQNLDKVQNFLLSKMQEIEATLKQTSINFENEKEKMKIKKWF